jgi:hypothetical protein
MIVGVIGLIASFIWASAARRRDAVVVRDDRDVVP